ncbi:putative ribonuclease H protein [Vitis vinifera]|uniref:Putative ribonuclease H protein n=1 Tax=Vitis vinifera TaxID=29760 RepID=A0A438J7R6_VITVI|nr:putative ribonuclease H protein [Vitis vinifera]
MRARGEAGGSRGGGGGRCCFVVEAKSFEILIEELGGKLRGCIWERSKGVSSWIRFREASLRCLLDGVEVCCREVNNSAWAIGWEEGNRKYRMEAWSAVRMGQGKGQSFGWNSLAERLRDLGVTPLGGLQGPKGSEDLLRTKGGSKVQWREKGVELKTYADAVRKSPGRVGQSVWIKVGEGEVRGRIEQMSQCLVGWWGPSSTPCPEVEYVRSWAPKHWALKGNLRVATLGRGLLLFDFELPNEAECVLARGLTNFKENVIVLERWNPKVGRLRKEPMAKEVWVRVIGLPLHLRSSEVFKRIGDECGGFIAADKSPLHEMQWARLLVVPVGCFSGEGSSREGEETGGTVCDLSCGSQREKVEQLRLQQGESAVSACGGDSTLCPAVFYEGGDAVEGRVGSADGRAEGGDLNGKESRVLELGHNSQEWRKVQEMLIFFGGPYVDNLRAASLSEAFAVSKSGSLTDEALRDEASRYVGLPSPSVGGRETSPSSLFSGIDWAGTKEGVSFGLISEIEGEEQLPLSIILADGSNGEMGLEGERSSGGEGRGDEFEILLQDLEGRGCRWDDSCLARFTKFLGFSTEGFEGEILNLLLRNKRKREQNIKKDISGSTKFDRELKKLEWSINYKGARKEKSLETKIQDISREIIHSLGVGRFLGWGAMSARGAAGRVVVFWDNRVLELMGMEVGLFSVSCRFKNCKDGFLWTFTGVYGPTMKRHRELFWEELGAIRGLWSDPWCIGGDFNVVRFPSERSREGRLTGSMRRFSEVQTGPFLISEDWENHFSGAFQCSLPRPVSDHFPILLDGGGTRRGPIPFRFENMWLKEEGFKELLKGWWQGFNYSGSYSFILTEKLKALKIKLKEWNSEVFGKVGVNKGLALDKVSYWDNQEQLRALNEQELEARKEAREEFKKWALMEETSWRQKSRENWLKEGDKNTGFFHKMANSNKRRNCLKKIKVTGTWLSEDHDIQRGVVRAFKDLLSDLGGWRPCCNNIEFDSIGDEEAARLEESFSGDEVFLALSDLNGDKAPGPDGFSLAFWQFCWDFVKDEVLGFFKDFYERGNFTHQFGGGLYKLLAKVLANRLKKVVGKVVSSTQNAFVEGRQILDAALVANEVIDSVLKRKESGVLCKLDFEKAYDRINWDFLLSVMQRMGFGEKWIGWIRWCISTALFSVLVNGSPTGFFRSSRGIGGREGVGIQVTHLLFADDTLVFCDDSQEQLAFLSWLLMWFEATSGLRINLNKSEILPVGSVENAELLAAELGCKVGSLPSTYLGLPLGASHKSVKVWDGVEERMRKKLALWKRQFISKGGRITLIRSTLASMPTYLMSLLCMPRVVKLRLEKIQRDFLWGGGALEKRPHLVKWAVVCTHKKMGGLGIRNLSILNRALLCKWSWRFAVERDSYWKLIISTKYGVERGGWSTCGAREGHGVGLWKEISKEGLLLLNNVSFLVGDGKRVRFWKDIWRGNTSFCEAFPSLFDLAGSKDAWVADYWDPMGE